MDNNRWLALQACLEHIEKFGWTSLNLHDIGRQTGLSAQEIHEFFPEKYSVITAFSDFLTYKTFPLVTDLSENDSYAERLFAFTLARFEAAMPYKSAIERWRKEAWQDPQLIAGSFCEGVKVTKWLLDGAGLETSGWSNLARVKIFGVAYLDITHVWLKDDTPDMAQTMARLDQHINRLSQLPGFF